MLYHGHVGERRRASVQMDLERQLKREMAEVHEAADEAVDTQPIAAKSLEGELEDLDTTGAKPLVALKTNARSKGEKIVGLTLVG